MFDGRSLNYYTKKEILAMDNMRLLHAFEQSAIDTTLMINLESRFPEKLAQQNEWLREELLFRLDK